MSHPRCARGKTAQLVTPASRRGRRLLVPLVCLLAVAVCGTETAAQSPFAMQALGQNLNYGSARDVGRGGWGVADGDSLSPGLTNPAALGDLRYLGLYFDGYSEATNSLGDGSDRVTRRAFLPELRLAFPLQPGRVTAFVGFSVQRSMRYEAITGLQLELPDETIFGVQRYFREGTLYQIPLGVAWRAAPGLALGTSVNLVRGTINDAVSYVYTMPPGYLSSVREQRDELSGTNVTVSVLWDRWESVQFGARMTTGYDLSMDRQVLLSGVGESARDLLIGAMPAQYRAGLVLRLPRGWTFGTDGQFAGYSSFTGRPDWEPRLRDEWTVSTGFERPLEFRTLGRGYRSPLRFGYQWRLWAHTVGGKSVQEQMVSVGTGFPFRNRLGAVDVSLSYVWIGSEQDNGYRSRSLRLGLSIIGLERLVF
jgi:hypothetical protein